MDTLRDKEAALARITELVEAFRQNEEDYLSQAYNETQTRTDFISPLLEAFGWDVSNKQGQPLRLREVIEEPTVEIREERLSKRPDYELRLARQRKLFVEAKKPSVSIQHDRASAFQVRRYGYSGSLPISVLTNFSHLAIYDCTPRPNVDDAPHVARLAHYTYHDYVDCFDDLWPLLARDSVYSGQFDRILDVGGTRKGSKQFDDLFLSQVRRWRTQLARDIHTQCPSLTSEELTYAVQLFLCRIIFLRICEDRDIEKYQTLQKLNRENTFDALMLELRRADAFYDSGIFRLLDDEPLGIRISDDVIKSIVQELYYPQSPYTFSVVETEVLGQIYEQFLGEEIHLGDAVPEIVEKPETAAAGGVVPTPQYIVDAIAQRALLPALTDKTHQDLIGFTIADVCCGSGTFLLTAYDALLDHYRQLQAQESLSSSLSSQAHRVNEQQAPLTFAAKRKILTDHIRGVDLDPNAVDVSRFSLLLKLIENETRDSLADYVSEHNEPALPSLDETIRAGNSLVSYEEWGDTVGDMQESLFTVINPLAWQDEFPNEMDRGGFDVILGNPPYIRIQNMAAYSPAEVTYYKHSRSPYTTAQSDNFDKYALFVERSINLIRPGGRLGVIVPHKFMTIHSGRALRNFLSRHRILESIVHFGAKPVFGQHTRNYTCILICDLRGRSHLAFEQVRDLEEWRYNRPGVITDVSADDIGSDAWRFADAEFTKLLDRVQRTCPERLGVVADIFAGMQTSADGIYIFESSNFDSGSVTLHWNGRNWPIERAILRPCLSKVTLYPYSRPEANAWMIFPYEIQSERQRRRARLIQPSELADRFPICWAYLSARRSELEDRQINGGRADERQWYQFGRSQSLTKFDGPKIVLPILSVKARYSYDDGNIAVTGGGNGPYYLIRPRPDVAVSNFYLLAILNHPLSEALVRTKTSVFRGGYYSHGKQFIQGIPIPIPSESEQIVIENAVADLIAALEALHASRTPRERDLRRRRARELRRVVDELISTQFALSQDDMDLVSSVPIPS